VSETNSSFGKGGNPDGARRQKKSREGKRGSANILQLGLWASKLYLTVKKQQQTVKKNNKLGTDRKKGRGMVNMWAFFPDRKTKGGNRRNKLNGKGRQKEGEAKRNIASKEHSTALALRCLPGGVRGMVEKKKIRIRGGGIGGIKSARCGAFWEARQLGGEGEKKGECEEGANQKKGREKKGLIVLTG